MLKARGDSVCDDGETNYLVFCHRYRPSALYEGASHYEAEMHVNVEWIHETIVRQQWAAGDRAIVIVSSVNACEPTTMQSLAYNLSKAAQNQLARFMRLSQSIRINTVSPATFTGDTPQVSKEDVGNVICFLCSKESAGINGQDLMVTR